MNIKKMIRILSNKKTQYYTYNELVNNLDLRFQKPIFCKRF